MPKVTENITIRDARLIFRNFAGKEAKYNREGDRNFCVLLDPDVARRLDADGWNVKTLKAREEGDPEQPYLQVSVRFKGRPARIVVINHRGRVDWTEEQVELLDFVAMKKVDLIINPYNWEIGGNTGVSAYLKSMFVTLDEDELEIEYSSIDEIPTRSGRFEE